MRFLLVHSPVVGPSTWRWVAEALRAAGHDASVPDLRKSVTTGEPAVFVRAAVVAAGAGGHETVIVGHSGAGAVLPLIAAGSPCPPRVTVFVDAGLPPCDGASPVGGDFLDTLRGLSIDGVLPMWSAWWGTGVMERLVPLDDRRRAIERDLPRVPLSFYETTVEQPAGWCWSPSAYVLLSPAYTEDAERAASLGWPIVKRSGGHLDIVNDGEEIASILVDLATRA